MFHIIDDFDTLLLFQADDLAGVNEYCYVTYIFCIALFHIRAMVEM